MSIVIHLRADADNLMNGVVIYSVSLPNRAEEASYLDGTVGYTATEWATKVLSMKDHLQYELDNDLADCPCKHEELSETYVCREFYLYSPNHYIKTSKKDRTEIFRVIKLMIIDLVEKYLTDRYDCQAQAEYKLFTSEYQIELEADLEICEFRKQL